MYFPIVELLFVQSKNCFYKTDMKHKKYRRVFFNSSTGFHVGTNRKCFYGFDDNYTKVECDESQYEMFCFKGTIDVRNFCQYLQL